MALSRTSLLILFVGVLLLNLMAVGIWVRFEAWISAKLKFGLHCQTKVWTPKFGWFQIKLWPSVGLSY
jgi:hypothetical protein